ncbi:MAG: hypothetical protein IJH32_02120 [Ruminococcus sp.]|nr:hypothetical protein [Ruminococcus sp.]
MIKRIVEADNEAKALEESNQKAAAKEKQRIENEAKAIYQRYMDEAKAEIAKDDAYLEKLYQKKLSEITAKQENTMAQLKADFEQNREIWIDQLVSRVIN